MTFDVSAADTFNDFGKRRNCNSLAKVCFPFFPALKANESKISFQVNVYHKRTYIHTFWEYNVNSYCHFLTNFVSTVERNLV